MNNHAMNNKELLELACLDALGLLDEHERRSFDEAFFAAPAALRQQIKREQARFARIESLLPDVRPRPELRAIVLAAVAEHVAASAGSPSPDREVLATFEPAILPAHSVSRWWRTAAISFAAAACVCAGFVLAMQAAYSDLDSFVKRDNATALLNASPDFATLAHAPDAQKIAFRPSTDASGRPLTGALAAVFYDETRRVGVLSCVHLESTKDNAPYQLVVLDSDGNVARVLANFACDATGRVNRELRDLRLDPGATLAILAPGAASKPGPVLMQAARSA